MGRIALLSLVLAALAAAGVARAAEPGAGTLSVERGRGLVVLEIRGSVLGRLAAGTLSVTDTTPGDRYAPLVFGRRTAQERLGARTILYRGQGLRFRLVGGGYRVVVRGEGISLSAVGRGNVLLHAERKGPADFAGVFSLDGTDCAEEAERCLPLPSEPERFPLRSSLGQGETGSSR